MELSKQIPKAAQASSSVSRQNSMLAKKMRKEMRRSMSKVKEQASNEIASAAKSANELIASVKEEENGQGAP